MKRKNVIARYHSEGIEPILSEFEEYIDSVNEIMTLEGKSLKQAIQEQSIGMVQFGQLKSEAKTLLEYYKNEVLNKAKGQLWQELTERSNIDLSSKDKEMYILSKKAYIDKNSVFILIQEVFSKLETICDAFVSRGFAIKNLTELLLVSLEEKIL